jgi:excisionase family DNA binding protein
MDERQTEEQLLEGGFDRAADVSKYLNVSIAQVYLMMAKGELPFTKIGRCRRVPHKAVVALAARNMVNAHT